ncbi:MAG: 50S ribosomal protein L16 [Candidatus Aenigmatarchaeota archaeon]|nr:MAG: 50S ribosomal protein L16 [Candidatus Aenigmarchaeota archaeon]
MALRPARCYRKLERPYTRKSKSKPRKSYVKGVPDPKIHRFQTGPDQDFGLKLWLISRKSLQIRHNALEAARVAATKVLDKLGKTNYFLRVIPYPHHVLRENPIATGAGADRFQTGMRLAFGNPIGTAAQVREGQKIMEVRVSPENLEAGKRALKIAASKLPPCRILIEESKAG